MRVLDGECRLNVFGRAKAKPGVAGRLNSLLLTATGFGVVPQGVSAS